MQPKKNIQAKYRESSFQQIEKMHPYKMLMMLAIVGIAMIFVFLVIAYTVSIPNYFQASEVRLPKIFTLATIILLGSSFALNLAVKAFHEDNMRQLNFMIFLVLLMGVIFTGCQFLGWLDLKESGIFLAGKSSGTFLYVISGLHLMHLSGGILFLLLALVKTYKVRQDPVKALIMVTNPFDRLRLELLTEYWHFLCALWLFLFFFFLYTF
jgi:cytochrome c oxidase subunit 3